MIWNHRVLAHKDGDEMYFEIHEVYYNEEGVPKAYICADVGADTIEGLKWTLYKIKECLDKPILSAENFPEEFKLKEKK